MAALGLLLAPVDVISIDYLLLESGQLQDCCTTSPSLYALYSGKCLLTAEFQQAQYGQQAVCPEIECNAVVSPSSLTLHGGDLVLLTRPAVQQLEGFRNSLNSITEPARCLRVCFDFRAPQPVSSSLFPTCVRGNHLLTVDHWPPPAAAYEKEMNLTSGRETRVLTELLIGTLLGTVSGLRNSSSQTAMEPAIAQTLLAMERDPGRAWTIEALAANVEISRSALSQKFKEQVGRTLSEHLLDVRMQLADGHLKDRRHQLKDVARMAGYQSVSAFSTAFKRWSGTSPGAHRKSPM